jgi:large subunit ribosomal protein L13
MKTFSAKPHEVQHDWFVVDAADKVLGRLAAEIARRLRGKHKAIYTPHVDTGDYVIVLNVDKVLFTGKKWDQKQYTWYTGYPRLRSESARERFAKKPARILYDAVRRMLPKNKLGRQMFKKLKVYCGADHPHQAQQPKELQV